MLLTFAGRLGQRLQHGLVVAGLALLMVIAVGASGAVLGIEDGHSASRSSRRTAFEVLQGMFDDARAEAADGPARAIHVAGAPTGAAAADAPSLQRVAASAASSLARLPERASQALATPPLEPGDRVVATVSFYYCVDSASLNPSGDGGRFCGIMRDGRAVYPGAAACDVAYLGQRFTIVGDPLARTYTCNDTGSAVHGLHRDIWFFASDEGWNWQQDVGTEAVLEIVP